MRIILFLLFTLCSSLLQAQEVVATAGNTFSNGSMSMSFTIGEGVANTLSRGNTTVTQGFHQSYIAVSIISETKDLGFSITAFPNPVAEILTLKVSKENVSGLHYVMYDVTGRILKQMDLETTETLIPVQSYSAGTYIVIVHDGLKEVKSFKIIKQ